MRQFRVKRPPTGALPDEHRMPEVGETVAVRAEGGARIWMADVRIVSDELLVVQVEADAYHSERDPISTGQVVHITGLGNDVSVRAETRGHNGSMLLLKGPTIERDRPKRGLDRAETKSRVWCTWEGRAAPEKVELFDLSPGGICTTTLKGMEVGQFVWLFDSPLPRTPRARGVIVGLKTTVERGDHAHIAFVAGTDLEGVEALARPAGGFIPSE